MLRPEQTDTRCVQRDEPTRPGSSSSLLARVTSYNAHDRLLQSKPSRSKPRALTSPPSPGSGSGSNPESRKTPAPENAAPFPAGLFSAFTWRPASPSTEGGRPSPLHSVPLPGSQGRASERDRNPPRERRAPARGAVGRRRFRRHWHCERLIQRLHAEPCAPGVCVSLRGVPAAGRPQSPCPHRRGAQHRDGPG